MDIVGGITTAITINHGPVRCTTGWVFKVVAFAPPSGELYGYAEGIAETPHSCDAPDAPRDSPVTNLAITGTRTPEGITLRFEYRNGGPYGISMLYTPPLPRSPSRDQATLRTATSTSVSPPRYPTTASRRT